VAPCPPPLPLPVLASGPEQAAAVRSDWHISGDVAVVCVMSRDRGTGINGGKLATSSDKAQGSRGTALVDGQLAVRCKEVERVVSWGPCDNKLHSSAFARKEEVGTLLSAAPRNLQNPYRLHSLRSSISGFIQTRQTQAGGQVTDNIRSHEERHLQGCGAVWVYCRPTFRRNVSPPSSG
jgi:hypothetical protein